MGICLLSRQKGEKEWKFEKVFFYCKGDWDYAEELEEGGLETRICNQAQEICDKCEP